MKVKVKVNVRVKGKGICPPEVVVITGASAGVGRATAAEFARHGAHLALLARGRDRLEATKREVEQLGGCAVVLAADISEPDAAERLAVLAERTFGPIDIWINNAMASVYSTIAEMPEEEFKRVTEVTYLGYVYGTKAALRRIVGAMAAWWLGRKRVSRRPRHAPPRESNYRHHGELVAWM